MIAGFIELIVKFILASISPKKCLALQIYIDLSSSWELNIRNEWTFSLSSWVVIRWSGVIGTLSLNQVTSVLENQKMYLVV